MFQKVIDISKSESIAKVYIEVGSHTVTCCATKDESSKIIAMEQFLRDGVLGSSLVADIYAQSELLKQAHITTYIIWENTLATCLPHALYNKDTFEHVFEDMMPLPKQVLQYAASVQDITIHYAIATEEMKAWRKILPKLTITHKYAVLLQHVSTRYEHVTQSLIYVCFYCEKMLVLAWQDKQLQLITSFSFTTDNDALYWLLSIVQQYGWQLTATRLVMSGNIEITSSLFLLLTKYFTQNQLETVDETALCSSLVSVKPAHFMASYSMNINYFLK